MTFARGLRIAACVAGSSSPRVVAAVSLALLCGTRPSLADSFDLVGEASLAMSPSGGSVRLKKERGVTLLPDPRCPNDATLRITTSVHNTGEIALPCTNWSLAKKKYVYDDPFGSAAGITHITWKSVSLEVTMGGTNFVPFVGPVDGVEIELSIGQDPAGIGPHSYCGRFKQAQLNQASALQFSGIESCYVAPPATPTPTPTGPSPTPTPTVEIPTAFRIQSAGLAMADPGLYAPADGCSDKTGILNLGLGQAVNCDPAPADGFYDLAFVMVFHPLDQGSASGAVDIGTANCTKPGAAECTADGAVGQCSSATLKTTAYTNQATGTCLAALPSKIGKNNNGSPSTAINSPSAGAQGCWKSDLIPQLDIALGEETLTLKNVEIGAQYGGNPATALSTGILRGFLTTANAAKLDLPQVFNLPATLAAGFNEGTHCPASGAKWNDLDGPLNGEQGWWMHLNFTAKKVTWQQP